MIKELEDQSQAYVSVFQDSEGCVAIIVWPAQAPLVSDNVHQIVSILLSSSQTSCKFFGIAPWLAKIGQYAPGVSLQIIKNSHRDVVLHRKWKLDADGWSWNRYDGLHL